MVDENIDLRAVLNDHLVAGVLDDGGNAAHVAESLITDTVVSRLDRARQHVARHQSVLGF